jgi:hypothetical protein
MALRFSFSRRFRFESDLRLLAESSRERRASGHARKGVPRQVEADNLDVERAHREPGRTSY